MHGGMTFRRLFSLIRLHFSRACVKIAKIGARGRRSVTIIMRKLVIKTAFITLGVTIILAFAVFGIVSLVAPSVMMRLTLSLGLERIGADYAYQEYERTGDADYLARSFEICAVNGYDDRTAENRFELLYIDEAEAFSALCEERDAAVQSPTAQSYRDYAVGLGATVKYRLANDAEGYAAAIELALGETDAAFPAGNPVIALAVAGASDGNAAFCAQLLSAVEEAAFQPSEDLNNIVKILEGTANE